MFWLVIPAAIGVAALLINQLDNDVGTERRRWQKKRRRVEEDLQQHQADIEYHLQQAEELCHFHTLIDLHYASHQSANEAYLLLKDAKKTLRMIGQSLVKARKERDRLKEKLKQEHDPQERKQLKREIQSLIQLRKTLFLEKEEIQAQKNRFSDEVKTLNQQTSELKYKIRDDTGLKGQDWYARLFLRTLEREY